MSPNMRLWKHPSSNGDEGDAYLYLEALVIENEPARKDFQRLCRIFSKEMFSDMARLAEEALSIPQNPKRLARKYRRYSRRNRRALLNRTFAAIEYLGNLLPALARRRLTSGLNHSGERVVVTAPFLRTVMVQLSPAVGAAL